MTLNKLLLRQIQKYRGGVSNIPAEFDTLLHAISQSYDHYEKDHKLMERTIDLNSREMIELNQELREETQKLQVAHQELKTLFENIDETFFSVDMKSYKLLQISHSCEKVYGYKQKDFFDIPNLWQNLIHPEDKEISQQQLGNLFIGKSVSNQYRIIHKDGSIKWIENKIIPSLDKEGRLERIDGITSEITERKNAETMLIESEKKYKLVFENPFLGVALGSVDGYVMNVNKAFCKLLGYSGEELVKMHFSTFTHPSDMEKEIPHIDKMMDNEIENYQLVKRYITKTKETIWVDLNVSCVKNEAGQIQFVIAVVQDITSRKVAEELRLKSEANLKNILENTDTAYVLLDSEANVLSYNKIAQQMAFDETGNTLGDGINYVDIMPEDKKEVVKHTIKHVISSGKEMKYEAIYQRPGKSTNWFSISMHPIFNENKQVLGLSVAATNITDRKKTEVQIKRSNERYKLVTKATKDIIWDWNFSNNKIYRSANFKLAFGYLDLEEAIPNESWVTGVHEEDQERIWQSIQQKLLDPTATLWEDQYMHYKANGEIAYVQDRGYIIRSSDSKPIRMVGAMRDITEEKLLSNERDKITSDLLQRNRDLEQFSFIISHNLRLPVTNIIGLINLIQDHSILCEKDYKECMRGLLLSSNKLDDVIKDLNYILQVRREINEKKETVLFSELVSDIKISIGNLLQKEDVIINTDFRETENIVSLKSYLYSIFFNLISNSIKFRSSQPPLITISSRRFNDKIVLSFKDNGLGIDLVTQANKIFGLYHKFHFHTEGKGMGLYMTKTQVEILGGKISIESAVNKGTEFIIEFQE